MKKVLILSSLLLGLFAIQVTGQITGSAHDFTQAPSNVWNTTGKICIVCHTPHNGVTGLNAPLWNHELSGIDPYIMYTSTTFQGGPSGQPDGTSKLCLGCHDGTVALENFGGTTGGTNFVTGGALVGGVAGDDLSNDHPISFTYDAALATADGELENPAVALSGMPSGGTINDDMLFAGELQCASCHDVHNNGNTSLLLVDNAGSALCLTCHIK